MTGLVNGVSNIEFVFRSLGLWSRVIIMEAHTRLSICMALPKLMIPTTRSRMCLRINAGRVFSRQALGIKIHAIYIVAQYSPVMELWPGQETQQKPHC